MTYELDLDVFFVILSFFESVIFIFQLNEFEGLLKEVCEAVHTQQNNLTYRYMVIVFYSFYRGKYLSYPDLTDMSNVEVSSSGDFNTIALFCTQTFHGQVIVRSPRFSYAVGYGYEINFNMPPGKCL